MADPAPTKDASTRAEEILKRVGTLVGNRGTWEAHWQEVAERVLPSYSKHFSMRGSLANSLTAGEKNTEHMYDATAALALTKFAAVMESMNTPRSSKWHRLVPTDKSILRNRQAREWFDDTNDKLFAYRYAPRANFASQNQEKYLQLGAFGTGCMFTDRFVGAPGLRYTTCNLADMYFVANHQGIVDQVYRRINFTAAQAVGKWGRERVVPDIVTAAEKEPDKQFIFWHCVTPNEKIEPRRADYRGMPFSSVYVSETGKNIVAEGGYRSFPYSTSRHVVAPGEVYGRSPAMMVLPNIKVLNEQKRTVLKQGHRAVDPILLAHDDGVLDSFVMKPGALNYGGVNADGRALVHALPVGNLAIAKEMMGEERAIIKDAFYITLFEILVEDRRDMTATEVLERAREKGVLLAPAMGREQTEGLGPQIEREVDVLAQQGLLLPIPQYLVDAGGEYKLEYDSPLSRAMRAEEASGFLQMTEMAVKVAAETQDPSALDWLDFDTAMPEIADLRAVPVRWIRSMEAVAARRKGRSDAAATQTLVDALPGIAGLTKAQAAA